ncbi:hypothetical protein PIB30_033935 [Stylosanthes scabra]|uniref:Putative plant transposon protein domain-containing protein n=1 Tax=Stylosanthes scabra TaxID=79078 RepID=A0ABU6Z9L3_9FABA|nr:hypothetical protein [Stylosanthes scabra]
MRPLLRGSELLETRAKGEMRVFRPTALTIKYTLTGGKGWSTETSCMKELSAWMAMKMRFSGSAYSDKAGDLSKQEYVFLRGKKIPFTEANIHNYLNIPDEVPDAGVDDTFVTLAKTYAAGGDMNMEAIYATIGRDDTNWADNLAVNLIPKNMNNSILNPQATAWHKIIMANIDPKTHGTKFDMKHALLIYVLMTEGAVNLPRIMRDILLVRPTKHPRHLLPFPVFITRLANRYEVPEFPNDKFQTIRPVDMYVSYGDWRGEKARALASQRRQPPPQDQPADQFP